MGLEAQKGWVDFVDGFTGRFCLFFDYFHVLWHV